MCYSEDLKVIGKRLNGSQGFRPYNKTGISVSVIKCNDCGLLFANPIPIPLEFGDHYNTAIDRYFDKIIKRYDEHSFSAELDFFLKNYKTNSVVRSLDIGAGLGKIMRSMERVGMEAYGIEPSTSFYEFATSKMGISDKRLKLATIESVEFEPEHFDFITLSAVFEHLYDPNYALVKALQWLKPGGLIYIGVPNAYTLNQQLINFMYKLRGMDYVSNISPMHPPFHIYEFTRKAFKKNALINKYSILSLKGVTYRTYLPKILDPFLMPFIRWTKTDMNLVVWIKK
jgi:2-polyprenyl-3-methyl-5-hydroxy-6-metoxy-1,4-benzoquinol methylase